MLCGKNKTFIRHTVTGQYKKKEKKKKTKAKKRVMLEKYTLTDMFKYQTCCISRDNGKWVVCVPFFHTNFTYTKTLQTFNNNAQTLGMIYIK